MLLYVSPLQNSFCNGFIVNPTLRKSLPCDTKRDFASLALIATAPNVLIVYADFPA